MQQENYVIIGLPGSGKTRIALQAAMQRYARKQQTILYFENKDGRLGSTNLYELVKGDLSSVEHYRPYDEYLLERKRNGFLVGKSRVLCPIDAERFYDQESGFRVSYCTENNGYFDEAALKRFDELTSSAEIVFHEITPKRVLTPLEKHLMDRCNGVVVILGKEEKGNEDLLRRAQEYSQIRANRKVVSLKAFTKEEIEDLTGYGKCFGLTPQHIAIQLKLKYDLDKHASEYHGKKIQGAIKQYYDNPEFGNDKRALEEILDATNTINGMYMDFVVENMVKACLIEGIGLRDIYIALVTLGFGTDYLDMLMDNLQDYDKSAGLTKTKKMELLKPIAESNIKAYVYRTINEKYPEFIDQREWIYEAIMQINEAERKKPTRQEAIAGRLQITQAERKLLPPAEIEKVIRAIQNQVFRIRDKTPYQRFYKNIVDPAKWVIENRRVDHDPERGLEYRALLESELTDVYNNMRKMDQEMPVFLVGNQLKFNEWVKIFEAMDRENATTFGRSNTINAGVFTTEERFISEWGATVDQVISQFILSLNSAN